MKQYIDILINIKTFKQTFSKWSNHTAMAQKILSKLYEK